jgi:hypothetical protein
MINLNSNPVEKLALLLTSLFIITLLSLQTVATFGGIYSFIWPFVNYPMYKQAHYEGESVHIRYMVFGILEDSTEVPILPEDLGLNFWKFDGIHGEGFVPAIRSGDEKRLNSYVQEYQKRKGKKLAGLRLEDQPFILSPKGAKPARLQTLQIIRLDSPVRKRNEINEAVE